MTYVDSKGMVYTQCATRAGLISHAGINVVYVPPSRPNKRGRWLYPEWVACFLRLGSSENLVKLCSLLKRDPLAAAELAQSHDLARLRSLL